MKIDRQGLETLYADMSEYELGGIDPDKLTDEARQVFAAEVARRGLAIEPVGIDTVYTAKHLFSVSPALRAMHFWGLLALRAFFVFMVLFECISIFAIFDPDIQIVTKLAIGLFVIWIFFVLFGIWHLRLWPYVVIMCLNVISAVLLLSRNKIDFIEISSVWWVMTGLFIVFIIITLKIHKDLRGNITDERPLEQEAKSAARAANRRSQLITGLATIAAMGAVMLGVYFYGQNQRMEKGLLQEITNFNLNSIDSQADVSASALDVNTFNLQCGISISLPNNWISSETGDDYSPFTAARLDHIGEFIAAFRIYSVKVEQSGYNSEYVKLLNAEERNKLAKKFVNDYESPEFDSVIGIMDRLVIDYKAVDLNGLFAILITAKGNIGQDKVTNEVRYVISGNNLFFISLVCPEARTSLLQREIDLILNSIAPARK